VYNGYMGRALQVIWLVLAAAILVVLGQYLGWFDLPVVRDLPSQLPLAQGPPPQAAAPTPGPPTPTVAPAPTARPSPAPVQPDVCTAVSPRFVLAMARLSARLGAEMGTPIDCEQVVDASGDTEQKTTTGLAYYRASINTPVFTNGVEHWALTASGLARWTGDDLEPPPDAEILQ
jgi:hypothetical protein